MELDEATWEEIALLTERGDELMEESAWADAAVFYEEALALLPPAGTTTEAGVWLNSSLGAAALWAGDLERAKACFAAALAGPGGADNAYLHLRQGQVLLDLGETEAARQALLKAHQLGGAELFTEEYDRYLDAIKDLC